MIKKTKSTSYDEWKTTGPKDEELGPEEIDDMGFRKIIDAKDAEIEKLRGMLLTPIVEFGEFQELHEKVAGKDSEIERLKAENEITVSVCNQNTDLKKQLTGLVAAIDLYLSLDGSETVYDAVRLQGARVKLREEIQRAKEAIQ